MRYRALTPTGDYQFGANSRFLVDSPATVAQAISTRLKLMKGEWFLDQTIGLDKDQILGYDTQETRDPEIQQQILGTTGVLQITQYSSTVDGRAFTVTVTVDSIYGSVTLTEIL